MLRVNVAEGGIAGMGAEEKLDLKVMMARGTWRGREEGLKVFCVLYRS